VVADKNDPLGRIATKTASMTVYRANRMTTLFITPIGWGLAKKMPGRIGVRARHKEYHDRFPSRAANARP
jgi:hypothetical protein